MHVRSNRVVCTVGVLAALASSCTGGVSEETGQSSDEIRRSHRSGPLNSRALINMDGTADFESSTGTLDSATPPTGGIEQLELAVFDGPSITFHRTFDVGGTPYFHSSLARVFRGQPFRVNAQVWNGASSSVADAVVDGNAKLRPDPSFHFIIGPELPGIIGPELPAWIIGPEGFARIIGPEIARVGHNVPYVVFFWEKNGDLGAKVDCVLSVDGVEAERQPGIDVTAGHLSRCEFRHRFTEVGDHAISVTLGNVAPGDYNLTNNSVSGTVQIIGPEHGIGRFGH